MQNFTQINIVGGGLAGLTAAIHLAKNKANVTVFEKQQYPFHRVCGEYVSNEVLPYLDSLGVDVIALNAQPIYELKVSSESGNTMTSKLPMGGFGLSRYAFDNALYEHAKKLGVKFVHEEVTMVHHNDAGFTIKTKQGGTYSSLFAIGSYGKRSILDKTLNRDLTKDKSSWIGVKAHYTHPDFPDHQVGLHNFSGGYCGLSKTETGAINACYLVSYESFKQHKNVEEFEKKVMMKNPHLKKFFGEAEMIFKSPKTIAQISFEEKSPVEHDMLMCGDAARLIHPLVGNGMAMAIHSAKIASELILESLACDYHKSNLTNNIYMFKWNKAFRRRLQTSRFLQKVLLSKTLSGFAINGMTKIPGAFSKLVQLTHGKPILT
ncbi:hypothetical protein GCM10009117_08280 [Gangjinia marincola]|uniref:FAD-binding domain-containing protein n=1 Tax=Gangjinia marincola TaxID=578463 RepID=A0ABN1MEY9_9FLAO